MSDDPITDVIALLRPRTVGGCIHATGPWAVRYEPFPHVRFGTVVGGAMWLAVDGAKPVLLKEGDFFLLGNPPAFVVGSSLSVRPRAAKRLLASSSDGAIRLGGADRDETFVCGGHFAFDHPNAKLLLDVLPELVHVRRGDPSEPLFAHLSALLVAEIDRPGIGSGLVIDRLAQVFLVQMLRTHADRPARPTGWLAALRDDRIGVTLRAMHAEIGRRWTLDELAKLARMSRSAFAAAFKQQVGTSPLDYLIEWRMTVARDALRHGTRSIAELAIATGYESESAFSTAFRRVVGASPKHFRAAARAGVDDES